MARPLKKILAEIEVYRSVMKDPRCPRRSRWLIGTALAYALSPVDIIPDFIPVIGYLDDLLIVPFLIWLALKSIPEEVIAEHRKNRFKEPESIENAEELN
jgi:uncharacterized membrane protein YkvA (DUF1232 family)